MKSPPRNTIELLVRLRWPFAAIVGLLFALTRLVEGLFFDSAIETPTGRAVDPIIWGGLAFAAIWIVLSWAIRQERERLSTEARMLEALRESNERLELLYEINQRVASSATLDEVLDYAITLPARLVDAVAATIVLTDEQGKPYTARVVGLDATTLERARAAFGLWSTAKPPTDPVMLYPQHPCGWSACLIVPLIERGMQPIGWIEAFLKEGESARREIRQPLLATVASELAEAVINSRRRDRVIASVAAVERAISAERTRIARDLHDGVAQSLAFMRMRIDLWEDWLQQEPERLREEFVTFKANLRRQIEELRRAIFALRPIEIGQLGFAGALRRFITEFADQQDWDAEIDLTDVPPDLPPVLELAAFRFVQEALHNIAKHAQAQRVWVKLGVRDQGLIIHVRDDGVGFNPGVEPPSGHFGLRQMRERAAALDGQVTIISRPGDGTEVRVWLPLIYSTVTVV
ncbi:MAG: two-component sensor histidine kinase [Chloroflexus sp.]|jgi:signal transduction histidine kinase|uniref:GAF domain-containing sensor histidine kinase n=1 Tax=Chloroflexus sp. TaxID=1904827 RepID=UPI0021DD9965|nr:sensor histidine kinase [Chloroflexus sp.]GIV90781.1 MAG: two-component sensor histidine kinase [Chloroflexus sp.]